MSRATFRCKCCGSADVERIRGKKSQPRVSKPPQKENARTKMWRAMRITRRFTSQEIASTSEAQVKSTRVYIVALVEAGYVRVVRMSSGEVGDYTVYSLVKDTGTHAPRLRADGKSLLDLNLDKEVPRVAGAR
jgi:hypothetical protein